MTEYLNDVWRVWAELSPWMLLGMAIAGALHVLLPAGFVQRHLRGVHGVGKAILVGVPLPLCSCGVIPAGIGLKKDGASDGASIGFLISTPQTGVDSILVSASMLGWPFALFKVASAAVTGWVGGFLAEKWGGKPVGIASDLEGQGTTEARKPLASGTRHAWDILASIWVWLVVGVLLAALITVVIPPSALSSLWSLGSGLSALAVLLIALPMYVCATASVPIAAALVTTGMPLGAALVLLMAGPATNVATMGAILRAFGSRILVIYLGTIIVGSLVLGWTFDFVLSTDGATAGHSHEVIPWWGTAGGVVLAIMVAAIALSRARRGLAGFAGSRDASPAVEIGVAGMNCGNCARKVERALQSLDGVEQVRVELDANRAFIRGSARLKDIETAITEAGFTPQPS